MISLVITIIFLSLISCEKGRVDVNPPTVSLLSTPPSKTGTSTVVFEWKGEDDTTPATEIRYYFSVSAVKERNKECIYSATNSSATSVSYHFPSGGKYRFEISAKDTKGNISKPLSYDFTIDLTPPSTPEGFMVSYDRNEGRINMKWEAVSDEDLAHYKVYRSIDNEKFECIGITSDTHFEDLPSTNHIFVYKVSAVDDVGNESAFSKPIEENLIDVSPPRILYARFPKFANKTNVDVVLGIMDNIDRDKNIEVFYRLDSGSEYSTLLKRLSFQNLHNGKHTVEIWLRDSSGNTSPHYEYSFMIDTKKPTTVKNLSATYDVDNEDVVLKWDEAKDTDSGLEGYNVYGKIIGEKEWQKFNVSPIKSTHFKVPGIGDGEVYQFAIAGVDKAGNEGIMSSPSLMFGGKLEQIREHEIEGINENAELSDTTLPYRMKGVIRLKEGQFLQIDPGVHIIFEKGARIILNGGILKIGSLGSSDVVEIEGKASSPEICGENDSALWFKNVKLSSIGLRMNDSKCILDNVQISNGYIEMNEDKKVSINSMCMNGSSLHISNCQDVNIEDMEISSAPSLGMIVSRSNLRIEGLKIKGTNEGIEVKELSKVEITDVDIKNVKNFADVSELSSLSITNGRIQINENGISIKNTSKVQVRNIQLSGGTIGIKASGDSSVSLSANTTISSFITALSIFDSNLMLNGVNIVKSKTGILLRNSYNSLKNVRLVNNTIAIDTDDIPDLLKEKNELHFSNNEEDILH